MTSEQIQQAANQDPSLRTAGAQVQAALRNGGDRATLFRAQQQYMQTARTFLQRQGLDPGQWEMQPKPDGSLVLQQRSWMDKHGGTLSKAIIIGGNAAMLGAAALGGAGGAGGTAAVDGTPLASSAVPAAGAASGGSGAGVGGAALAGGGGSGIGQALAQLGGTVGAGLLTRSLSGGGNSQIDPALQQQYREMADLQLQRMRSQQPVHAAAMKLAMSLSPGSASGGARLQSAIQQAQTPRPQMGQDPQVMAAIQQLMGGR